MPLTPYQYRPATPPSAEAPSFVHASGHSRNTSGSSCWSIHSSPDSVATHVTTPSRSPPRQLGPTLLPKIRTQDQALEPTFKGLKSHRRALSSTRNPPGIVPTRPAFQRSTTTPPECISLISPVSPTSATSTLSSAFDCALNSATNSPISWTPHFRKSLGHIRSTSASSIDDVTLGRYGYPTYRRPPAYITSAQYSPSVIPGSSDFVLPPAARQRPQRCDLAKELIFDTADEPSTNLEVYLTGANPSVNLVQGVNSVLGRGLHPHFWWDIRNVRSWEDFTFDTIKDIPGFAKLLGVNVRAAAHPIPTISQSRLHPHSESALSEILRDYYAVKVNAALKTSTGYTNHLSMRAEKSRDGPQFISNYQNDVEKTLSGNGRGRVVGIVRSFDRWHTGMRFETPKYKVLYLEALSELHRHMREHSCRYGFIMTEIELVCVRAGTDDLPYFGFLELAPSIETSTKQGLTACLALWYLHMLAKEEPLPGQCGWKIDVGAPAAMSRMNVMEEKDSWIPDPGEGEKRDAKRSRGWVMPNDPWNRRRESKAGHR